MATRKQKKKRKSLAPKLLLVLFVISVSIVIVKNNIGAKRLNEDTAANEEKIVALSKQKAWLEQELAAEIDNDYIAREAQRQGYAAPNERIFYDKRGS